MAEDNLPGSASGGEQKLKADTGKVWINPEILNWHPINTGGFDIPEWKRSYEHWRHASDLATNAKSELKLGMGDAPPVHLFLKRGDHPMWLNGEKVNGWGVPVPPNHVPSSSTDRQTRVYRFLGCDESRRRLASMDWGSREDKGRSRYSESWSADV